LDAVAEEIEDGLPDGRHARLWRRSADLFFRPAALRRRDCARLRQRRPAADHGAVFTPSGRSIQAKGILPDIEVLQEVPEEIQARSSIETKGESALRGHLKAEVDEQGGSQSYVPPEAKDDKALNMALDLIRGTKINTAFPPNPK
jgi:hypothetical protein